MYIVEVGTEVTDSRTEDLSHIESEIGIRHCYSIALQVQNLNSAPNARVGNCSCYPCIQVNCSPFNIRANPGEQL